MTIIKKTPILPKGMAMRWHREGEKRILCKNEWCSNLAWEDDGGFCYMHMNELEYIELEE